MFFGKKKKDADYIKRINKNGVFDNSFDDALPQTTVAKEVRKHFESENQKHKKALIIALDGARADSMLCIVKSDDMAVTGDNCDSPYSGVCELKKEGGLYLSYAGAEVSSPQETSTAQGFASILTGEWGVKNGVIKHTTLNDNCPTVLREYAEKGISASFLAIWPDHFNITYKNEVAIAKAGKIPLEYKQFTKDLELHKALKDHIKGDTDIIFGIYEGPDINGHTSSFSLSNYRYTVAVMDGDSLSYELIEEVKKRKTYPEEDWLIIITSDHGGHNRGHGTQMIDDRMTFLATNKKIK
ncbi:MAG: hypothetical protein RR552_02175 [Oscillospiraceae bacterium]